MKARSVKKKAKAVKMGVPLDPPEMTEDDFEHAIRRSQRQRIIAGRLEAGDDDGRTC